MNIIESVRNLFNPGDVLGLLPESEVDKAWANANTYGLPRIPPLPPPMSWDGVPVYAACTTAESFPNNTSQISFQPMTELTTSPLEDWICSWCGNMWASDIRSCEKCGGPKQVTV